jgi:Ser/Thr protein kinase RdoA (MazF antagonist)
VPSTRDDVRPLVPLHAPELDALPAEIDAGDASRRARFTPDEIRVVLSRYDVPPFRSVRELPRGSERSPKALVETPDASFVLKRWTHGQDDPSRVAGAHAAQLAARAHGAPVAPLFPTRSGSSMLVVGGFVYELSSFMPGSACPRDEAGAHAAGEALARLHAALSRTDQAWRLPDSRLSSREVAEHALLALEPRLGSESVRQLRVALDATAHAIDSLATCPSGVLHGDAHPGNLLAERASGAVRVTAILDFANVRRGPHVEELAQAASHWSLQSAPPRSEGGSGTSTDAPDAPPETWPAEPNMRVLDALVLTYASARGVPLTGPERAALRPLMARSILIEASGLPDAPSPRGGARPLALALARKALWLLENAGSDHQR